jgi:hypothetical protein
MRFKQKVNILVFGVFALSVASYAQTSTTGLQDVLGPGVYANFVWSTVNGDVVGEKGDIKFMRNQDGQIKTIKSSAGIVPIFTWDGLRIVYNVRSSSNSEIRVMDTTGSNDKSVISGYFTWNCWQDPGTKKNYVIATNLGDGQMYRIDIDNPASKQQLFTPNYGCTGYTTTNGNCWVGMSGDGKYMAGGFCAASQMGIVTFNLSNPSANPLPELGDRSYTTGGRYSSIAHDNSGDVLHQIPAVNVGGVNYGAHQVWIIEMPSGQNNIYLVAVTKAADFSSPPIPSGDKYQYTRWSNNRDFLTCSATDAAGNVLGNVPNPRIVNIKTMHWVGITDSSANDNYVDMFVYGNLTGVINPEVRPSAGVANGILYSARTYDFCGRAVSKVHPTVLGIYLSAKGSDAKALKRIIVIR